MPGSQRGKRKGRAVARKLPAKKAVARPKARKINEQEFVRETVSKATGVHFEVVAPHPAFPLPAEHLAWFMRCRNKEEIAQAPYLNAIWKEKRDGIWLESLAIGDTIDWIELAYGEEKATKSIDTDYSYFDDPEFQADFNQKFPIVMGRIREYEQAAADVSKNRKVRLQIRRAGSRGMLVFTLAAVVQSPKSAPQSSLGSALKKNVAALKEAYGLISQL